MGNANSGKTLSLEIVERCERLIKCRPVLDVANELGLDAGTVRIIRAGQHPMQRERTQYQRCPSCGGRVLMPCQMCAVESAKRPSRRAA